MVYCIPTDTCYGLGCHWHSREGYERVYVMKNRALDKPLSLVVRHFDDLKNWVVLTDEQMKWVTEYPFPFTLIAPRHPSVVLPSFLSEQDYAYLGVRVAERCLQTAVIDRIQLPIFLTSANKSDQSELYSSDACREVF